MKTLNLTNSPIYALMHVTRYSKVEGTKNTWNTLDSDTIEQTKKMYNNTYADIQFFRNLGGREIVKGNTLTSISPDGEQKTIRVFDIKDRRC